MNKKHKISVVIVTYNQKEFIGKAVESVLNQTLRPYEIIICDDASEDGTIGIIRSYEEKYPGYIRVFVQKKHSGIAENKNMGLRHARGGLVTTLDGDDIFLPEKLEKEFSAYIASSEAGIVYSNCYITNKDGKRLCLWAQANRRLPAGDVFKDIFTFSFPGASYHNELVETEWFRRIGYIDPTLVIWEDWDFRLRLTKQLKVVYCQQPLWEYRQHQGGTHNRKFSLHFLMLCRIYKKNKNLLNDFSGFQQMILKGTALSFIYAHKAYLLGEKKGIKESIKICAYRLAKSYYLLKLRPGDIYSYFSKETQALIRKFCNLRRTNEKSET
ncbi:MAG: glycosyltransferase [Candidatus Omnitrophota bacterium]